MFIYLLYSFIYSFIYYLFIYLFIYLSTYLFHECFWVYARSRVYTVWVERGKKENWFWGI